MKLHEVIVVFALVGSTLGNVDTSEGGGASSTLPCLNIPEDEAERAVTSGYIDKGMECLSTDSSVQEVSNFTSIEEFRQFLGVFCQRVPAIKQCIAKVLVLSKACQNQTTHQPLEIIFDIVETVANITCREGSDGFANLIFHGLAETSSGDQNIFNQCLNIEDTKSKFKDVEASDKPLIFYRRMKVAKDCLVNETEGDDRKTEMGSNVDEFLSKMKCFNPEDKSLVLCATIDHN